MNGPNADLFVSVLAQIEKHPETWQQANFSPWPQPTGPATVDNCGTGMCMAGWTCIIAEGPARSWDQFCGYDRGTYVSERAADHLGIDRDPFQRLGLFAPSNTLAELYEISADLLGLDETVLREKVAAVVADGSVQQ